MGDIFAANEEAHQRPAFERAVFANCAAQNRIFLFQRVEQRLHGGGAVDIDVHLIADFGQGAQVMRKNNANHCEKIFLQKETKIKKGLAPRFLRYLLFNHSVAASYFNVCASTEST